MNDILPPKPQSKPPTPPKQPIVQKSAQVLLEEPEKYPLLEVPKRRPKVKVVLVVLGSVIAALILAMIAAMMWYQVQLQPVDVNNKQRSRVMIQEGSSPAQIGDLLEKERIIRSSLAFDIYTRLNGVRSALQAGSYSLSPSESMDVVVKHLTSGWVDEFTITFLPGATLADHRDVLSRSIYSAEEINQALKKVYDHPLFADKPAGTDLEGYIYGETYRFPSDTPIEQVLTRTFDEFYSVVQKQGLVEKYRAQGLNLYQGITLASIIQKEVSHVEDQKQVAQVFLKRLEIGMPLGADATFVYGAKKAGATPSVDFDSPYNTRIHGGLPPGPIASPGKTALEAVGSPAAGDYLFFVSGDDGRTHFARTQEEHDANTRQYCHANCNLF